MKNSTLMKLLLIIIVISFAVTSCSSRSGEVTKIRIGHFPNVTHAQALIARELGYFSDAFGSLEIDYKVFNAGPSQIEAFFAGEVDIGYIGPVPAINGNIRSMGDILIIAGATNAGALFLVNASSDIYTVSDLAGKRVAIPQIGNTQHLSLLSLLSQNNLKDTSKGGTVEVFAVPNPDIKALLDSGDIDAAYVPEPWGSRLLIETNSRILLDEKEVYFNGEYSTALVIVHKDFYDKNPELVEKFLEAHLKATLYLQNNPSSAMDILNAQIETLTGHRLDDRVMNSVFERLYFSYDPMKNSVLEFMKISKDEGFVERVTTEDKLFDFRILNKVLEDNNLETLR